MAAGQMLVCPATGRSSSGSCWQWAAYATVDASPPVNTIISYTITHHSNLITDGLPALLRRDGRDVEHEVRVGDAPGSVLPQPALSALLVASVARGEVLLGDGELAARRRNALVPELMSL